MTEKVKTAIVTGGARGIGRAISLCLSEKGWQIYLTCLENEQQEAQEVCSFIQSRGGKARSFVLDIRDHDSIIRLYKEHVKDQVLLDVLVNNAGIAKDGLIVRLKPEDWSEVIQVNLNGTFYCLQEASKIMLRQRHGRIINISSLVGLSGNPGQSNYSSSKAGLVGLTKSAALELAPRGITVNAVAPGFVETEMTGKLDPEVKQKYLDKIPMRRYGTPEDVAKTVAWLASEDAGYITGQIISVNGGLYL
ncbi:MAG TPA: 3-oxoacyl-[acyl-carrier-protein] reductase [Desulfohalobiaceae bacterium]|nr:3-oxoacyl-[acyl-carrier-protein] reductase [Desulfohalobiaceae bacterium]